MDHATDSAVEQLNQPAMVSVDADGIAMIWLDTPGRSANTLGSAMFRALDEAVARCERERFAGVIVASRKPSSFVAGADLFELAKMDAAQFDRFLAEGQAVFNRLAALAMPTVAAIGGDCLGGGLELALACRYRVAAKDRRIQMGLPEVKLGVVPGWGGTVRLPALVGLKSALPLLLVGKPLSPEDAKRLGLVDEIAAREELLECAKRLITSGSTPGRARTEEDAEAILDSAARETAAHVHPLMPAPMRLIEVLREGQSRGAQAGMAAERRVLVELAQTESSRNLVRMFILRQVAKKNAYMKASPDGSAPREVQRAAVIGGGTMGAGIVYSLARAGIEVQLIEVNDAAAAMAMNGLQNIWNMQLAAERLEETELPGLVGRISVGADWSGIGRAELVIEAVPEELELKREVFSRLSVAANPDAILASNTSSIDIAEMARAVRSPERVVGMHFFNPVPRMFLVEIVRGEKTSPRALLAAVRVADRLGKAPVIATNAPGFIINRVLMPYLVEAMMLAGEGTPIGTVDAAMRRWGWPMGPFELMDQIGLDVTLGILRAMAGRLSGRLVVPSMLAGAVQRGWRGKKSGIGFYIHHPQLGRARTATEVNPEMEAFAAAPVEPLPVDEEIQRRLMLPMMREGAKLLEEKVADSADDVDLATVLGLGFPAFRGGLMTYAAACRLSGVG